MKKLKKYIFGFEAIEYIRYILEGGKTLSSYLLQNHDLDKGKVIACLPEGVSDKEAKEFEVGGKLNVPPQSMKYKPRTIAYPIPNTDSYLAGIVQSFLITKERRLCILEDATRRPDDPIITPVDDLMFAVENEVYYMLSVKEAENKEKVARTINVANSLWHFVCVMTSFPKGGTLLSDVKNIKVNDLKILADRAEKIAIGAYDGEGYLIWERKL